MIPLGARVRLQLCPHGEPGVVVDQKRGKVIVEWRDLGLVGKHAEESLMVVGSSLMHKGEGHNGSSRNRNSGLGETI